MQQKLTRDDDSKRVQFQTEPLSDVTKLGVNWQTIISLQNNKSFGDGLLFYSRCLNKNLSWPYYV